MAFSLGGATVSHAEIADISEGLIKFVHQVVEPLEERHRDVLENPRLHYTESGRPTEEYSTIRKESRMAAADAGYYTMFTPSELGGGGLGAAASFLVLEGLLREFGPGRPLVEDVIGKWNRGPSGILKEFSDVLRSEIGSDLMSGRKIFCFALSEPDAGSDAWAMTSNATRVEGGWILNGVKQWISDSPYADFVLVFAVSDSEAKKSRRGGISAFMIPMDTPG